jgi:hypothetical protein
MRNHNMIRGLFVEKEDGMTVLSSAQDRGDFRPPYIWEGIAEKSLFLTGVEAGLHM